MRALFALSLVAALGCGKTKIDESCLWYHDADQDGFGNPAMSLTGCDQPAGYVNNDDDCNDADPTLNPETEWHPDADMDGFGASDVTMMSCVRPADHIADASDCDDTDPDRNPDTIWYQDADNDGFGNSASTLTQCDQPPGYAIQGGDCDDTNQDIVPGTTWYADVDQDGFGDPMDSVTQCAQPAGYVLDGTDCNDMNADEKPGQTWHLDFDNDGFGHPGVTMSACAQPAGHVLDGRDCDDMDDAVYPGTGACPFAPAGATSCLDILNDGNAEGDGVYMIDPDGAGAGMPYAVWCDMTTDGGGWTALLNRSDVGLPNVEIPGMTSSWSHVGGTGSTCTGTPYWGNQYGWWGYFAADCGNWTNQYTFLWANSLGATDIMFAAVLGGYNTYTIEVDGVSIPQDAASTNGYCHFWNATGTGLPPGTMAQTCGGGLWLDVAPHIYPAAFTGGLQLVVTVGAGCQPDCTYGEGFTLFKLMVR